MVNKKCPSCGFINFLSAECCRKCETPLSAGGSPEPVYSGQGAPFGAFQSPYQYTPPKSEGGFPFLKVFLCLLGGLILVSVITGGGVAWLKRNSTVAWREFHPTHGSYNVMMPTEPKARDPFVTPLPEGNMVNHMYSSTVMGQGSALYCVITFPLSLAIDMTPAESEKILSEEVTNILAKSNSTLVSKKSIVVSGNPGMEFEFRPPANLNEKNARGFGKVFIMQNEEYLFLIIARDGSALLSGKEKFLNPIVY